MIDAGPGIALLLIIVQPWLWALVCVWRARTTPVILALGALVQAVLIVALLSLLVSQGPQSAVLWGAPEVGLRADGVAVFFLLLSLTIASAALVQVYLYFNDQPPLRERIWPLVWTVWGGMNLIWLGADFLLVYIGMEVVAVAVVLLIALSREPEGLRSAMRYLQAVLLGTLALFIGAGLLLLTRGSLALASTAASATDTAVMVASVLITVGLMYRAALFPLHAWLPPAHGSSYAPLSALLSALVTKASFYVLARFWLENGEMVANTSMATALGVFGAAAILWGGWMACRQEKLKMLVAYSSVNQIGYFFLLFPLIIGVSAETASLARDGAFLQVVSHALAKAALFMAAGNLVVAVGSDKVSGLAGVSRFLPLSLLSFGLAGVSIMGLPPSGGFLAKWYLLQASLTSGQWWWAVVLLLGGLLSAAYIFRVFRQSYLEGKAASDFHVTPGIMDVVPMLLAFAAVGLGLMAVWPMELLSLGATEAASHAE